VLERDLAVPATLHRLAVPLHERVAGCQAQPVEQGLDRLPRLRLPDAPVDGDAGGGAHERAARPPAGLEASAVSRSSISPASRAARPASTPSRKARAIAAGSSARAIAVLTSTASAPSSIASA